MHGLDILLMPLVFWACCAKVFFQWSWYPLVGAAVTAVAFAVKIPIEEKLILKDENTGEDYARYKRRVTSKIIPYVF